MTQLMTLECDYCSYDIHVVSEMTILTILPCRNSYIVVMQLVHMVMIYAMFTNLIEVEYQCNAFKFPFFINIHVNDISVNFSVKVSIIIYMARMD